MALWRLVKFSEAVALIEPATAPDSSWTNAAHALLETLRAASLQEELRLLILSMQVLDQELALGAGQNLPAPFSFGAAAPDEMMTALCASLTNFRVPVIVLFGGVVSATEFNLGLACHMRIAARDAQLLLSDDSDLRARMRRVAGPKLGAHLVAVAERMPADAAYELGLVNRVVTAPDLVASARELANTIALLAPLAVTAVLRAVIDGSQLPLQVGLELETELFCELFDTSDAHEGPIAFLEKRAPGFSGR